MAEYIIIFRAVRSKQIITITDDCGNPFRSEKQATDYFSRTVAGESDCPVQFVELDKTLLEN